MATAATPLSDSPSSMRMARMPCQLCIWAASRVQAEASSRAVTITFLRPMASESGPLTSSPTASMAVEQESASELLAGEMPKSCDSTGSMGCSE